MQDCLPSRQLQQVEVAGDVGADIGARVFHRIAHAGLRGEMHDAVHAFERHPVHRFVVGDVGAQEGKAGQAAQAREPGALQHRVVVAVEIVDADYRLAAAKERSGGMHADEAGDAGDENAHGRSVRVTGDRAP